MAAHEHLSRAQFHQREGRPSKHEHDASEEDTGLRKPHVHVSRPSHVHHGKEKHGRAA